MITGLPDSSSVRMRSSPSPACIWSDLMVAAIRCDLTRIVLPDIKA
ncbi:MAG TPA: hypothetical protein VGK73_21215 [Polyangiaceae bacterium]